MTRHLFLCVIVDILDSSEPEFMSIIATLQCFNMYSVLYHFRCTDNTGSVLVLQQYYHFGAGLWLVPCAWEHPAELQRRQHRV